MIQKVKISIFLLSSREDTLLTSVLVDNLKLSYRQ